jgi:ribose 5-phosphate isomerase B
VRGTLAGVRIAAGSDHAGFHLKQALVNHVRALGHEVVDLGTHTEEAVDYPDFGAAVGRAVVAGDTDYGLCVCGTGIGISIAANKISGVRAAVVHDVSAAKLAREHNDANVACFGARLIGPVEATDSIEAFLSTGFDGGRHAARIAKIAQLESKGT